MALMCASALMLADASHSDIGFLRELDDEDVHVDDNGKKVILKGA